MFVEGKGKRSVEAFRVMAPYTPERATLQKDAGANAVTIVYAEFLYIKYNSRFHYAHQLSFLIISPIQTKNNKKLPLA